MIESIDGIEVHFTERGTGAPIVVLHGGAGPFSVVPWAEQLSRARPARVITPTHPGFMGTPRPDSLTDVRGLAKVYAGLLRKLTPQGALVIGNSIGGWIGAELALLAPEVVTTLVLVNAVGIEVPAHPVTDVLSMPLPELAKLSYFEPEKFKLDPSKLTADQQAAFAANRVALKLYSGATMVDPTLRSRLSAMKVPTHVVWGEADRIVDADYGRAFAAAIPDARFTLLPRCGHLPQLEAPEALINAV
ncbi:MAG: alpha/beta hydrolase [Archangium sp.]